MAIRWSRERPSSAISRHHRKWLKPLRKVHLRHLPGPSPAIEIAPPDDGWRWHVGWSPKRHFERPSFASPYTWEEDGSDGARGWRRDGDLGTSKRHRTTSRHDVSKSEILSLGHHWRIPIVANGRFDIPTNVRHGESLIGHGESPGSQLPSPIGKSESCVREMESRDRHGPTKIGNSPGRRRELPWSFRERRRQLRRSSPDVPPRPDASDPEGFPESRGSVKDFHGSGRFAG